MRHSKIVNKRSSYAGFTLVELVVSIGIFAFMTALMVAKYGNFNQSVLLTNLAYDVAVTIRTAQSYGLSVKGTGAETGEDRFQNAYGVYFDSTANVGSYDQFILFSDYDGQGDYDPVEMINTFKLKRGATISGVCFGDSSCSPDVNRNMIILFKRPDPSAKICQNYTPLIDCGESFAKIQVKATDGNTRIITVRENGQISVVD